MLKSKDLVSALSKQGLPLKITNILVVTLLMFLLLGISVSVHTVNLVDELKMEKLIALEAARDLEWQYIETVLHENYSKAELQSNDIKEDIDTKVALSYPSTIGLKEALDNPSPELPLYKAFRDTIKDRYLNGIVSDSNDPFIATHTGIITDLSLTSGVPSGTSRLWEGELGRQYNKVVGAKAIQAILNQDVGPIFWEYTAPTNPNHIVVSSMDLEALRYVYQVEGLDGLKTYEFLKPSYIKQHEDILGNVDVNALGVRQSNYKIIVVSGFSLYDILMKEHLGTLACYKANAENITRYYDGLITRENGFGVLIGIILLICILVTSIINNHIYLLFRGISQRKEDR